MKIVFMGTPEFSVPILEALIMTYDVCLVVTQPDKCVGRHRVLEESPVKKMALAHGITCFQPIDIKTDYKPILECNPDVIITAAYGQLVPDIVLEYPRYKSINVHASLLPKLRGGAPIHKAITRGYHETGVTIMYMVNRMDAGDIISCVKTTILDSDNETSLRARLSLLGRDLLMETLPRFFNNEITPIKQNEEEATYASNVSKKMEHINFKKESRKVFNLIRGLSYTPGAYGIINGVKVKIYQSKIISNNPHTPGEVLENKKHLVIGLIDGELEIIELQVEGKKRIMAKDFLNGQKLFQIGDIIE